MPLVTRVFASSEHAWDPMASSSVNFCRKTRTVPVLFNPHRESRTDLVRHGCTFSVSMQFMVATVRVCRRPKGMLWLLMLASSHCEACDPIATTSAISCREPSAPYYHQSEHIQSPVQSCLPTSSRGLQFIQRRATKCVVWLASGSKLHPHFE
jgi:hypothetical protein